MIFCEIWGYTFPIKGLLRQAYWSAPKTVFYIWKISGILSLAWVKLIDIECNNGLIIMLGPGANRMKISNTATPSQNTILHFPKNDAISVIKYCSFWSKIQSCRIFNYYRFINIFIKELFPLDIHNREKFEGSLISSIKQNSLINSHSNASPKVAFSWRIPISVLVSVCCLCCLHSDGARTSSSLFDSGLVLHASDRLEEFWYFPRCRWFNKD